MLIYEKNNKLNINFDNEISENPDLQIGKEDGKTSVTIDGQPGEGLPPATSEDVGKSVIVDENGGYALGEAGGQGPLYITVHETGVPSTRACSVTVEDIKAANSAGRPIYCRLWDYKIGGAENGYYDGGMVVIPDIGNVNFIFTVVNGSNVVIKQFYMKAAGQNIANVATYTLTTT
jgi:hypothetical protein